VTPSRTPTVTVVTLLDCPNALPSRLIPGERGYVTDDDPTPINVRSSPTTTSARLFQIPIRTTFDVIEGPRCGASMAWYLIEYGGRTGWIAEGQGSQYFVQPYNGASPPTPLPTIPSSASSSSSSSSSSVQSRVEAAVESLPACSRVLVEEDFERGARHTWFEIDDASTYTIDMRSGGYQINMRNIVLPGTEPVAWGSLQELRFSDARVDAVIYAEKFNRADNSRTGVWLRYQNGENFLAFMMSSGGSYRIARFQDEYHDLHGGWTGSRAIRTGTNVVNTLSVVSEGSAHDLYINEQFATRVQDSTWGSGRIAFFGSTTNQPAVFSLEHLRVCGG